MIIQLPVVPPLRYRFLNSIEALTQKKKASSRARSKYKKDHSPDGTDTYGNFFIKSDSERKVIRERIRFLHLANNFLKGTPYKKAEQRVSEENRLLTWHCAKIFSLIEEYLPGVVKETDVVNWAVNNGGD